MKLSCWMVWNLGLKLLNTEQKSIKEWSMSVSIDQRTGQRSPRGNENVKIMVDRKPSNIPASQLLKQLPSNAISKVEIITNPSAKYEPEGNSGIINIITQKNVRRGYHVGLD